jgi:hypothetical protein
MVAKVSPEMTKINLWVGEEPLKQAEIKPYSGKTPLFSAKENVTF